MEDGLSTSPGRTRADTFSSTSTLSRRRSWTQYPDDPLRSEVRAAVSETEAKPRPSIADSILDDSESMSNGRIQIINSYPFRQPQPEWTESSASIARLDNDLESPTDDLAMLRGGGIASGSRRYSESPLRKGHTTLRRVSRNIRRMSMRVVNFAGADMEDKSRPVRLVDDEDEEPRKRLDDDQEMDQAQIALPLQSSLPLRGRTLGFLGPNNPLRQWFYRFLVWKWTEPTILILIIINAIVLTMDAATPLVLDNNGDPPAFPRSFFTSWSSYVLFFIFVLFLIETIARMVVSGFLLDPEVPTTSLFSILQAPFAKHHPNGSLGTIQSRTHSTFAIHPASTITVSNPKDTVTSVTSLKEQKARAVQQDLKLLPFRLAVTSAKSHTQRGLPYLRHSWSRIDFIAVCAFWINFVLVTTGVDQRRLAVFRALSVLRTARLLAITSGTTTIMKSLKTARPLLANVAYFVVFAMALFSIIGVQSFKGSLRRSCFITPVAGEQLILVDSQRCGGFIDPVTLNVTGWMSSDGAVTSTAKGYICPIGQICKQTQNPEDSIQSFDTIFHSLLQVVVIASINTWSPLMYQAIDADYFVSSLFFVICVIVVNFWLLNLVVAVITNTFSAIRSDTQKSAFGAPKSEPLIDPGDDWAVGRTTRSTRRNIVREWYNQTYYIWVALALGSLVLQATRTNGSSGLHVAVLDLGELAITLAFDVEILWRFLSYLPDWRSFFLEGGNWLDMTLAIGSSIIQIPLIHVSAVYSWLTIFQLARFYRVILVVPRMRPLLLAVFGNMYGLVNMSLFLILANYLGALVAVQFLRGDLDSDTNMNFSQIYNSFLAMYQVFSSENWTTILYDAAGAELPIGQSIITILFVAGWFLFANFIILQLFIAVINENFDIAEESKRGQQATNYWASQMQPTLGHVAWLRRLNPYRWMQASPKAVVVSTLPSNLVLPMQEHIVQELSMPRRRSTKRKEMPDSSEATNTYSTRTLRALQKLFAGEDASGSVPMSTFRHVRRPSAGNTLSQIGDDEDETRRHLNLLAMLNAETDQTEERDDALYERRARKADFIRAHPTFDYTFWIFSQRNPIRRICQTVVQPAGGERIFGKAHSDMAHALFQLFLLLTVIAGVAIAGVATPEYRRQYYFQHGFIRGTWFDIAEASFGLVLLVEFVIKIIADGFVFTPNAYVRSIWNVADMIILVGLIVNLTTSLIFVGGLSRLTRALRALRALRIITLIEQMRSTFQSLIFAGAIRILDAALLAMLYMIPYAVWGLNIFSGLMFSCNDGNANNKNGCVDEYVNTVYGDSFGFPVPRVWDNPHVSTSWSFDSFRSSLLILFEIVSLEGWIDVMGVATSIVGRDQQLQTNAAEANSIFFLVYNLLGAVVILTLFVSIIIGNFSSRSGLALLTKAQRQWIDLQKLIRRQRPSVRPRYRPASALRSWCFDRAVSKHGWWSRGMTVLYVLHVFALMTQTFTTSFVADQLRDKFFIVVTCIFIVDILVRMIGLGWKSFRSNGWNVFDCIVVTGSFATTLAASIGRDSGVVEQLQKLFLVSIAFKLVQRTNSLNQLFKTAVSSLPVILSLLALWIAMMLFFALLYVEVFGQTRWMSAEDRNQNYSSLGSAFLMLAFMSTGEGWNQYMHDYAVTYPYCTNSSSSQPYSDCGSVGWTFSLFIAWNILSMYIFVNMFTGVVVESFSYVFQLAGEAKTITREEMRNFKRVWAQYASGDLAYLERSNFVPFFGKLSGVFQVRIYPPQYSVSNLREKARPLHGYEGKSKVVKGLDLVKLDSALDEIDFAAIRERRKLYSRLYHEAIISQEPGRGISFTNMLILLAHYKLIDDREALVLKDLVPRTETLNFVEDLVSLDRVRSLLKTIHYRKRFLAWRAEQTRSQQMSQSMQDVPEIIIDGQSPYETEDIVNASRLSWTPARGSDNLAQHWLNPNSPDDSFASDLPSSLRRDRRGSDLSMLGGEGLSAINTSRDSVIEDPNMVLSSLQNSLWGNLLRDAAEEEAEQS